jgi:hypothetical protein
VDRGPAGVGQQGRDQVAAERIAPAARAADNDLSQVVAPRVVQDAGHQVVAGQGDGGPAQLFGELQGFAQLPRPGGGRARSVGALDMGHGPGRLHHHVGEPPAGAHERRGHRVWAEQHQDPLARRPGALDAGAAHGAQELVVHRLGGAAQGQLAQGREVLGLEEAVGGETSGLGDIDLALGEALAQLGGGDVDQLDLVGAGEGEVGDGLALAHPGDLPDHVHQALEVLDVQRGPDVDAGGQQLVDVLPAFRVARAGGVGVGVFVDQQQLGPPRQRLVEVEFEHLAAAVFQRPAGHHLQAA